MPSRQEKKNAKRRAKYLKTRIRFSPSGTTKQSLKRNGPLNVKTIEQIEPEKKRTSRRARCRADPQKERTSRRTRYRADPEKERAAILP